jgi:hypothetical protein
MALLFPEDLPDSPLPNVPANRPRVRFPAHRDPDHGPCFRRHWLACPAPLNPQVKKLPPKKKALLDEVFKGPLPADTLVRTEPFFWLQRLYLGQLLSPFFAAPRKDFSSSGSPRSGKKAVLVTTFSLGRLVCSFHEAGIIVKFRENIQRFLEKFLLPLRVSGFSVL